MVDEDYPRKGDLIRAGGWAAFSSLVGFTVTYALFVHAPVSPQALARLDRRAAEQARPSAYRNLGPGQAEIALTYGCSGLSPSKPRLSPLQIRVPRPAASAPPLASQVAPEAPRARALPLPELAYQRRSLLHIERPRVSFGNGWERAREAIVPIGLDGQGVAVGPNLVLTTLTAYQSSPQGILLASDAEQDLALLEWPTGDTVVTLAGAPAAAGEILMGSDAAGPERFAEVRSRGTFDRWLGFYGWRGPSQGGGALVNREGQLVGLSLAAAPWSRLSWGLAVPAPQLAQFLQKRPRPKGASPDSGRMWVQSLAGRLTGVQGGTSLGPYQLGMRRVQLEQQLGSGQVLQDEGDFQVLQYPGFRFQLVQGQVVAIETDIPGTASPQGWIIGGELSSNTISSQIAGAVVQSGPQGLTVYTPGWEFELEEEHLKTLRVVLP